MTLKIIIILLLLMDYEPKGSNWCRFVFEQRVIEITNPRAIHLVYPYSTCGMYRLVQAAWLADFSATTTPKFHPLTVSSIFN